MLLTNETNKQIHISDTITLPNGGVVYLDADAYAALNSVANSYDWRDREWTSTVYFQSDAIHPSDEFKNTEL